MKSRQTRPPKPIHDYSNAIERALSWLGRRQLLAAPINPHSHRPSGPDWYLGSDRWLEARDKRAG